MFMDKIGSIIEEFNENLQKTTHKHVESQTPQYAMILCSDSRAVPAHLVDDDIYNKIFPIETAWNTVWKRALASSYYALEHLKVELLFVMWHSECWACKYAFSTKMQPKEKLLDEGLADLKQLATKCMTAKQLEIENVKEQVKKLRKELPKYASKIVWIYYDLKNKKVEYII